MARGIFQRAPAMSRYLFTSESVSEGHPDKMCDQISDAVLDAALTEDPKSRVACESLCKTGFIVLAGEITTRAKNLDFGKIARGVVKDIGYTDSSMGFDADTLWRSYRCRTPVSRHFPRRHRRRRPAQGAGRW